MEKILLKVFEKLLMNIFGLIASFEAFWSLKKRYKIFDKKCLSYNFHV